MNHNENQTKRELHLKTGVCPDCGACDGFVEFGKSVWLYCYSHQIRWHVPRERVESILDLIPFSNCHEVTFTDIYDYQVVNGEPHVDIYSRWTVTMSRGLDYAITHVVNHFWEQAEADYFRCQGPERQGHVLESLQVLNEKLSLKLVCDKI